MFRPHEPAPNDKASDIYAAAEKHNEMREENLTNFMDNLTEKLVHVINDTDERLLSADNPQAELLRWHYRLGHISFTRLRILALLGTIPRKLIHAKTPKCAGCMYGAMTKQPWRTKAQQNKSKIKSVTRPGDCVLIDQLESLTPGFRRTTERSTYQETIPSSNGICQSRKPTQLHSPPARINVGRNGRSKMSIRSLRKITRS
jgi:hypothetical protein